MPAKRLLPYHVTVSEYAAMRNVSRPAIYRKIDSGDIVLDEVGFALHGMIDLRKYKDVSFGPHADTKTIKI